MASASGRHLWVQRAVVDALGRHMFLLHDSRTSSSTVLLLEAGGAVTYASGLCTPRTCTLTHAPTPIREHCRMAAAMAAELAVLRNSCGSWSEDWVGRLATLGLAPLYWEPDSALLVSTWAKNAAMQACPVIPGQGLGSVSPLPASPSPPPFLLATRDAPGRHTSAGAGCVRAEVHPVLVWTQDYLAVLTDTAGARVGGLAWGAQTRAAGCVHPHPPPLLDVCEWRTLGDGFVTFSSLPRPTMTRDGECADDGGVGASLSCSSITRLLISGGWLDARSVVVDAPVRAGEGATHQCACTPSAVVDPVSARLGRRGPHVFSTLCIPSWVAGGALARASAAGHFLCTTASATRHAVAAAVCDGWGGGLHSASPSSTYTGGWEEERGGSATGGCATPLSTPTSQHDAVWYPDVQERLVRAGHALAAASVRHAAAGTERAYAVEAARVASLRRIRASAATIRQIEAALY